jgi:hypothetical protein
MPFQGSLSELPLPDIIQLVSVGGKNGVFQLTDGAQSGQIYLRDGQIVHATFGEASGEEAVYALAMWNRGEFRFDPGVATEQHTIKKSNTNLLMEAARRLDEWRVLSKKIPSMDLVPEFVVHEGREGQISLNTMEWLLLSKIDGRRSLKAVAAAAGLSAFDTAKILYGLVGANLIRLKQPATVAPPAGARPPAPPPKPAAGASPAATQTAALLARLERVRQVCNAQLGPVGESMVNKHYEKARSDIGRGAGGEAIDEAVNQIVRAAAILKGPSTTGTLLEQLKNIR